LLFWGAEPLKPKFREHRITIFYEKYEPERPEKNRDVRTNIHMALKSLISAFACFLPRVPTGQP